MKDIEIWMNGKFHYRYNDAHIPRVKEHISLYMGEYEVKGVVHVPLKRVILYCIKVSD